MDRRLTDALSRHAQIHDWTARRQHGHSVQLYLVGGAVENVRHVERESYEVELFNDHTADGTPARGSASVPMSGADLDRLDELLDDGALMASLVHNPPWALPDGGEMPDVQLADPTLQSAEQAERAALETAEQIRGLAAQEGPNGVRLSSAELFINLVEEELHNSRGLQASAASTRVMVELTLLARGADGETEFYWQGEARRLADLRIDQNIADGARLARDKLRAEMPATRVGPVIVSDEALAQMLGGTVASATGALLTQASAASAYAKLSRFEVGQPVHGQGEALGDRLTVRANAQLPYGVMSYRFDADGVSAQDVLVIADGILTARPATQRYGQYLHLPVTGRAGMMDIAPGSATTAELLGGGDPACHVLAFSAPNVDTLTGDFGMEIRIGYERGPAGTRPIAGGSITGNLFDALADVRLASETRQIASTLGPAAMRFGALQITGRD
jgi:PmbA protein